MSEQKIQTKIRQRLESHGWFVTKLKSTSTNGIPDLLCIKRGRIAFLEVKTDDGVVSELQKYMIDKLNGHGCYARVVRSVEDVDVMCGVNL
jgi:Holliday junction resolvase